MYLLRVPTFLRRAFPEAVWEVPALVQEPKIYLTFDDGPHPEATPFVLKQLEQYNAKGTFFCIGKNVIEYPDVFDKVKANHVVGNHTHQHLKGRRTKTKYYLEDVERAAQFISGKLFRPPYGSIKKKQALTLKNKGYQLVMWSLLSGDFDSGISPQRCLENVIFNLKPGDIVVFHDSQKAWVNLNYALPRVLAHCQKQKWGFGTL